MSLATRCTACGTVFRVVQDQLKVSDGWVRCGKCQEVFNALEGLVDLTLKPAGSAPAVPPSGFAPSPSPPPAEGSNGPPFGSDNALFQQPFFAAPASSRPEPELSRPMEMRTDMTLLEQAAAQADAEDATRLRDAQIALAEQLRIDDEEAALDAEREADEALALRRPAIEARAFEADAGRRDEPFFAVPSEEPPFEPSVAAWSRDDVLRDDVPDARPFFPAHEPDLDPDDEDFDTAPPLRIDPSPFAAASSEPDSSVTYSVSAEAAMAEAATSTGSDTAPAGFLRDAERRARRESPLRRVGLSVLAVLLVLGLASQAAFHFRDLLAARWPALAPSLTAMCNVAGCSLQPPRRIDEVLVDSSALTRLEGIDGFRLSVVLHNRSSMALQLPAVDLSLTDSDGRLVARRALQTVDFGLTATTLPAGGEQTLQLLLSTGDRRVTGYTVELFYP